MLGDDKQPSFFEKDTSPESPPKQPGKSDAAADRPRMPEGSLISVMGSDIYHDFRKTISDATKFEHAEDSLFPTAPIEARDAPGVLQLRRSADQPLLSPEQEQILAEQEWERIKRVSAIESDITDILSAVWVKAAREARSVSVRAVIRISELMRMRGIKPRRGGQGRRGGYSFEQKLEHLRALSVIQHSWLNVRVLFEDESRKRPTAKVIQSRPFVVTDRMGQYLLNDDNYLDVEKIVFLPGEVFAVFLMGGRQTAVLHSRALNYNPRTQLWEKRLSRYYSHLWRCRSQRGDYQKPLEVLTIFREGLGVEIDTRLLAKQKKRLSKCLRTLQRDGVIGGWRLDRQDGPWSEWTIIVEPPSEILQHYSAELTTALDSIPTTAPIASLKQAAFCSEPLTDISFGEQIQAKRKDLHLSQSSLATQLKLSQAIISRVERGGAHAPERLKEWFEARNYIRPGQTFRDVNNWSEQEKRSSQAETIRPANKAVKSAGEALADGRNCGARAGHMKGRHTHAADG